MWISFIHISLISCVHDFMCPVVVLDPVNSIVVSKASCGLFPVLEGACPKGKAFL